MVRFSYGSLARSGKVKAQTPRVGKSSTETNKYNGSSKFRSENSSSSKQGGDKLNTFVKYNTVKGFEKLELIQAKKEKKIQQEKNISYFNKNSTDTNHKKWHRNHPKQGFYQSRQVFNEIESEF